MCTFTNCRYQDFRHKLPTVENIAFRFKFALSFIMRAQISILLEALRDITHFTAKNMSSKLLSFI